MPNSKISALPAVTTVGNTDIIPVVQGGATKSATVLQLLASVLGANPPAALDTLRELADAIGDDPNYATKLVTQLAAKANTTDLAGYQPINQLPILAGARWANLTWPNVQAHRSGELVVPENTIDGSRAHIDGGIPILNPDIVLTGDSVPVCLHDSSTGRTITGPDTPIGNYTAATVRTLQAAGAANFAPAWTMTLRVPTLEEYVREFGGKIALAAQAKGPGYASLMIPIFERYGIRPTVSISSFFSSEIAVAKTAGYRTEFVAALDYSTTPDAAVAVGADQIDLVVNNVNPTATTDPAYVQSVITAAHAAGQKVQVGTLNRRATADRYTAMGADQISSGDPYWVARKPLPTLTADPFAQKTWWHGSSASQFPSAAAFYVNPPALGMQPRGVFLGTNRHGWGSESGSNSNVQLWILDGWATPFLQANQTQWSLTWTVTWDALGNDTARHADLAVLSTDEIFDASYSFAYQTSQVGVSIQTLPNGTMRLFKVEAAAATQLSAPTTAAMQILTLSSALTAGAAVTSLPVTALAQAIQVGNTFLLPTGQVATATATALAGATAVTVASITPTATVASGAALPQQSTYKLTKTATGFTLARTDSTGWTTGAQAYVPTANLQYLHRGRNANASFVNTGLYCSFSSMTWATS